VNSAEDTWATMVVVGGMREDTKKSKVIPREVKKGYKFHFSPDL
jgi:hypothetical protein